MVKRKVQLYKLWKYVLHFLGIPSSNICETYGISIKLPVAVPYMSNGKTCNWMMKRRNVILTIQGPVVPAGYLIFLQLTLNPQSLTMDLLQLNTSDLVHDLFSWKLKAVYFKLPACLWSPECYFTKSNFSWFVILDEVGQCGDIVKLITWVKQICFIIWLKKNGLHIGLTQMQTHHWWETEEKC